jgi:hypothetical protein
VYLLSVARLIACKDASLFEAFSCLWTPSSTFYKLLEIERPTLANYVDNNFTPTIASNLLAANAFLPWQAFCQRAKRFGPLLCATIGHPPACYARQCCYLRHTMQQSDGRTHAQERPQPTCDSGGSNSATDGIAESWGVARGTVNAAYLSPAVYVTVYHGRYGVEVQLST